eukprot:3225690-Alexandrium_andersonii.AAC.1
MGVLVCPRGALPDLYRRGRAPGGAAPWAATHPHSRTGRQVGAPDSPGAPPAAPRPPCPGCCEQGGRWQCHPPNFVSETPR